VLVFGGKSLSWGLFVSQMLGTGYFTHGSDLVNVVSWFVSLILLCYVLFAAGLALGRPRIVMFFVAAVALALVSLRIEVNLSRHVLVFALATMLLYYPRGVASLVAVLFAIGLYSADPQLLYPGIGIGVFTLATRFIGAEPRWLRACSQYNYEFFLVHGIFLVGMTRFLGTNAKAVVLAIGLALVATLVLHLLQSRLHEVLLRVLLGRVPSSIQSPESP
jgi:hypothetical protein